MSLTPITSRTRELASAIASTPLSARRRTTASAGTSRTAKLSTGIRTSGSPISITRGRERSDITR
jgi:hypothetical protein